MKRIWLIVLACVCQLGMQAQDRSGLTEYKLDNGLTVMLWEDHDQPDVTGYVAVRAGAVDEPEEYTGLAHYLEHMLFTGTEEIGALDWEKERPIYERIVALYDQLSETTDEVARGELIKQINEASMEEAQLSTKADFFTLMDGIGATGVNAYTSYDMTCYLSSFPANQMQKWLTISSDRLIRPVFRTFQAELENVFEEYNMYANGVQTQQQNYLLQELYKGHPYERSVIGKPEHLKNPRLSQLIAFYNTWYVANNMALILVGDFKAEEVKPLIASTFGRLERGELPARKQYADAAFQGGRKKHYKVGYYPQVNWAYEGAKITDEDIPALELMCALLNNGSSTGLLDKITMDGEVTQAVCGLDARRDMGRIVVTAIPYYDINQRTYESDAATERIIMRELSRLKTGDIPDWLLATTKAEANQNYILTFEEGAGKMGNLVNCFVYGIPTERIFTENATIQSLTKEDIQRVAQKYLDAPCMNITFDEGEVKTNKLQKPQIKPLEMPKGKETAYAKKFREMPSAPIEQTYLDMQEVQVVKVDENIRLHHTKNEKNGIFSLLLRYGVGTEKMPMLEYVVALMNRAGVMPDTDPQDFRRQLSELGGRAVYDVDDSYLTIQILGDDAHMKEICNLVNRQILMPRLDQKQFDAMKGSELMSRFTMRKMNNLWGPALLEYVVYGKKSVYLDVVPFLEVYDMDQLKLMTEFQKATKYALDVHYCGTHTAEEVLAALPLQEDVTVSTSPEVREKETYDKTQVYFLPNSKVQQASIYFYFNGTPQEKEQTVPMQAFNQYFSGGFTGLVMDEIRTKRSMAYTAYGLMSRGRLPGKKSSFMGYIGTQSDKVVEAVSTFMSLLDSMPANPERIEPIRNTLLQTYQINKPTMRNKSMTYARWQEMGYQDDPAKEDKAAIEALQFEQIMDYYRKNIQHQPVSIIIVGDPKQIDTKALGRLAKVKRVSVNTLFAPVEFD